MALYLTKIKTLSANLRSFEVQLIPRSQNTQAYVLSKLASSSLADVNRSVFVEVRQTKYIEEEAMEAFPVSTDPSWMDPIIAFKKENNLPEDKNIQKRIKRTAAHFCIINEELYRKSFSSPFLKCVGPADAKYILREIHLGICGNHIGGRTLAHKALRAGYWWPTMIADSKQMVQKCDKCQKYAPVINLPARDLTPILNPLPFAQWGLDLLEPFPTATYQKNYLVVGVDYFTKWIEAEALSNISEHSVRKFIWQNIITRFGIPKVLVMDHAGNLITSHCPNGSISSGSK